MRRPSHATVVAYTALFIALGGGAYAALNVDSRDVENDSLRSRDLADDRAVKGRDVVPDSLSGEEVDEASLSLADETILVGAASQAGGSEGVEYWMSPSGTTVNSAGKPQITTDRSEATMVVPSDVSNLTATGIDIYFEVPSPGVRGFELFVNGEHTMFGCEIHPGQTHCTGGGEEPIPPGAALSIKTFISTNPSPPGDYIRTALHLERSGG